MPEERAAFWNHSILKWEKNRYFTPAFYNIFSRLNYLTKNSLRSRRKLCLDFLYPNIKNCKILELGAGAGHLASLLIKNGATSYMGVDFSSSAINEAKNLYGHLPGVDFECKNVAELLPQEFQYNVIFSLGLIDWSSEDELNNILMLSKGKLFLHSFSQKSDNITRIIHRYFSKVNYQNGYRPKYFSCDEILAKCSSIPLPSVYVYCNPKLSFGAFLTNIRPSLINKLISG